MDLADLMSHFYLHGEPSTHLLHLHLVALLVAATLSVQLVLEVPVDQVAQALRLFRSTLLAPEE